MTTPINKILTNHKQTLSVDELANVSASLSAILGQGGGGGGEPCASAWLPSVSDAGVISWTLTTATTEPATANIKGPSGDRGPAGQDGQTGATGDDGYSPTITLTPITAGDQTGTEVEFTYGAGGSQSTAYTAWNGKDGTGATDYFDSTTLSGDGSQASPYGVDTTAAMNLTHTSAYSAIHAADALSSTSAFWAVKAKYGDQRVYDIGSEIYGLTYFRTSIINWTNLIHGDRGVETLDPDEDGYPEVFQLDDEAWSAVSSVSAKSTVTSAAGHVISAKDNTNNPATNFAISAVDYMRNLSTTAYAPQRLVVVTGDNDIINNHATYSEGVYGTLFFVTSAHT